MEQSRMELIEEMLKNNPDDSFLNYAAALEYKKNGRIDKSIELLEGLTENDPEYLATYYQLGKLHEQKGNTDKAIDVYKAGKETAKKQNDIKTLSEISEALLILDADDGEVW